MKRSLKWRLMQLNHNQAAVQEDVTTEETVTEEPSGSGGVSETTNETTTEVVGKWPDNWRELYAGEDDKRLGKLNRYASPSAAFDALFAANQKLSSGEYKSASPFPENGTDEEKTAWREQNGVANAVQDYEFEGIKESDKEFVDSLAQYAIDNNIPKQYTGAFVDFLKSQDEMAQQYEEEADNNAKQVAEDKLRVEWGNDFRRNVNMIHGLLDTGPEGVKDAIINGRGPDGTPLGSNPAVMQYLADLAFQINPITTLVPNSGGNPGASIQDEIAAIEKVMGTDAYYKDEKMQERYRQLIDARERMK